MGNSKRIKGRALVTGAAGFVGHYLMKAIDQASDASAFPHVAVVRRDSRSSQADTDRWSWRECELVDWEDTLRLVEDVQPDIIVHLAAQSSAGKALLGDAADTWHTNCQSTLNLAKAANQTNDVKCFLFSSSVEVYGRALLGGRLSENAVTDPQNAYASSKLAGEHILRDVLLDACKLIVTRPVNHSGKGQTSTFVLPSFAAQVAGIEAGLRSPEIMVGNLKVERDFIHVEDVARAMVDLLCRSDELPHRTTFNVSSGRPVLLRDVLNQLIALSSRRISVVQDPERMRPSDIPRVEISPDTLKNVLGWAPKSRIDQILQDVLDEQRLLLSNSA